MLQTQSTSSAFGFPVPDYFFHEHDRAREVIDDALLRCGMQREAFRWNDLELAPEQRIVLPIESAFVGGDIHELGTNDLFEFKRWVGFDDEDIARMANSQAFEMPVLDPSELEGVSDPSLLTPEQAHQLDLAARAYLYGPSQRVERYRTAIERIYSPMRVSVVAARRIVLAPGSELAIHVYPTLLIAEEIVFAGGRLTVTAKSRIHAGRMTKEGEQS
jgi:hypothetical protein